MKDLLSKKHFCCKTHTLQMKSGVSPLFIDYLSMEYPHFPRNSRPLPFSTFLQKSVCINKAGETHSV